MTKFIADGAYDGKPTHDVLATQFGPEIEIIIPPPVTAVMGSYALRDAHLAAIQAKGRTAWQQDTGYNTRSGTEAQTTETTIAIKALDRMTNLGPAAFEPVT